MGFETPQDPHFQNIHWGNYGMRGGGGYDSPAASIASAGQAIAGAIRAYAQMRQQRKQDDLANALMNNGQAPGADPYVRRATYEDGDQGEDPGPTPFASTDTPHSGGQNEMKWMAAAGAQRETANAHAQRAQQADRAFAQQQRAQDLRARGLDLAERGLNQKADPKVRAAATGTPDSWDSLIHSLKGAVPKDDALTLADLGRANWTYGDDPNTTTLKVPTGEEVDNPDFIPSTPQSLTNRLSGGLLGEPGNIGSPMGVPATLPGSRDVNIQTGQAQSLFDRLTGLNSGNPQMIGKGGAVVSIEGKEDGPAASGGNPQVSGARAWLNDPKNANDPRRGAIAQKLAAMGGR